MCCIGYSQSYIESTAAIDYRATFAAFGLTWSTVVMVGYTFPFRMDDGARLFVASPAGTAESGPTRTIIHTSGSLIRVGDKLPSLTDTHALHILNLNLNNLLSV